MSVSYASVNVVGGLKQAEKARLNEKTYVVVAKPKESVKMSSDEVKEKMMKDVSDDLNTRVRAVRKTRSSGIRGCQRECANVTRVQEVWCSGPQS